MLFTSDDYEELYEFVQTHLGFNETQAKEMTRMWSSMQDGYTTLSLKAIRNILPFLRKGMIYSEAVSLAKIPDIIGKENWAEKRAEILSAINDLNRRINLYDYDLVVMPQSSSRVNQYMLRYIYRFAQPTLRKMELVKNLPANISFDMDAFNEAYLDDVLENGRPRYTEAQKEEVRQSIRDMLDFIHKKEYFTIARDVRKSRFRPYMTQFLRFATEADRELCQTIRQQNVLILDDVTTSGSTLGEVLRTLRILNEDNSIAIFSLIGRRDLMADINI